MSGTTTIDLSQLDPATLASVLEQATALRKASEDAAKAARDARIKDDQDFTRTVGEAVVTKYLPEHLTTFESGAQGVMVAGCKFEHEGVQYTISSVLVRVTSTIPAKTRK